MAAERSAVVGGFVLGALALAVAGILFLGGTRFFERSLNAVVLFDGSVAGLDVGAPVSFRGVRVGSVRDIAVHLSPEGWAHIYAYLELLPSAVVVEPGAAIPKGRQVEDLVAKGLRAELSLQSFVTSQLRVDLNFRPDTPANLIAADTGGIPQIPAVQSNLERLQSAGTELPLQDLAQAMLRTLASGERLIDQLGAKIDPLSDKLDRSLAAVATTMETATETMNRLQAEGSQTLRTVDELLVHAQHQVDARGADLATTLQSASRAANELASLAESANSLVAQRSRLRGDIESTARDLAASASSLRGFAQQIERNPSLLVRGTGE